MKKMIMYLLVLSFAATGCQKDVDENSNENQPPAGSVGTYQPVTKGSYWKYKQSGLTNAEFTLTSLGTFLKMDGRIYHQFDYVFENAPNIVSGLAYQDGKYYTTAKGISPNSSALFDLTQLYLNEKEAAGFSWTFDGGQGNGIAAKVPGRILEKDISITVAGKTYKNVIHTQVDLSYELPVMGEMKFATYDYYVAKNIGIVKIIVVTEPMGDTPSTTSLQELLEYSIK